jgi:hypothetical protein
MGIWKEDKVAYNFKVLNPTDFKVVLVTKVKGKMFDTIFSSVIESLKQKNESLKNLKMTNENMPSSFVAERRYHNLIMTSFKKSLNQIEKDVGKDGIHIVTIQTLECKFDKDLKTQVWTINATFGGLYNDKRRHKHK